MKKLRTLSRHYAITSILAAAVGLSALTAATSYAAGSEFPYPTGNVSPEVQQLPDSNVYYVLGIPSVPDADNEGHTSNAGFIVTDSGVLVFDVLGTPSLGYALLQKIREVTDKPIKYVVVSHYHADHIYGLQAFRDHTDALIIAHKKAYDYIHDNNAGRRLAQRIEALSPWVNENTRVVEPDITFTDELKLRMGGTSFNLIYAGPAHATDDIMMVVKPGTILFAGDIVQNRRIPYLDSPRVDTENWLQSLEKVHELDPKFIIPGHGDPSTDPIEGIEFTQAYIKYVRKHMQEAVEDWIDFETAYSETDWSEYKDMPTFNAANKGNAYRVFLHMEQTMLE